jgi:hypothetical protein
MTENLGMGQRAAERPAEAFDELAAGNIAPLVVWLGSTESKDVTGRVFSVGGGRITVLEGWSEGPVADKGARWDPAELSNIVPDLVKRAAPNADMRGRRD